MKLGVEDSACHQPPLLLVALTLAEMDAAAWLMAEGCASYIPSCSACPRMARALRFGFLTL